MFYINFGFKNKNKFAVCDVENERFIQFQHHPVEKLFQCV